METKHVHISQKHQAETTCYHCSNTCELEVVVHQEKSFCCTGCRSVFQILKEANLCDYYSIEAHAGVFTMEVEKGKFDYLEDANTLAKLVDFQNDTTISVTFRVPHLLHREKNQIIDAVLFCIFVGLIGECALFGHVRPLGAGF